MRLDCFRFLAICSLTFCLTKLLQQGDRCALNATAEFPACAGTKQLHQVLVAQVEKLVKINATVGILAECAFLLHLF